MNVPLGIALIAIGVVVGIAVVIAWRRIGLLPAVAAMAIAGAVVGAGALLVQDEVELAEWVVTLVAFVVVAPVQAHLVLSDRRR